MTVCIVGHKGNMGRRYATIVGQHLGKEWVGIDVGYEIPYMQDYIIATPTDTHIDLILDIKIVNKDATILCEKPITTNISDFERIPKEYWDDIYMVNQYRYYPNLERDEIYNGSTEYAFYHSGNDGVAWDCIQLIHLAKNNKRIRLSKSTAVWHARINGVALKKDFIDMCYVNMFEDFLHGSFNCMWNLHRAYEAHKDVMKFLEAHK